MSQPLARLFEKWLDAGGDWTFNEWLAERRRVAESQRRPGAVIGPFSSQQMQRLLAAQQAQQLNLYHQQPVGIQQMLALGLLRGANRSKLFGGILG